MGARNGTIAAREAEKLAKTPNLYLTTTHFHPEHAGGEKVLIRPGFLEGTQVGALEIFDESRLTKPGKCPACRNSRIFEPQISVE